MSEKISRRKNRRAGFTLAELLIVVAITVILAGVGFISIFQYQQNLKFTEMENDAREVFLAAQNSLTGLKESGTELTDNTDKMDARMADGPSDFKEAYEKLYSSDNNYSDYWKKNKDNFRYIVHESGDPITAGSALDQILGFGSIDETIRTDGSYVIEYDQNTYTVYGVFYTDFSKDNTKIGDYYSADLNPIRADSRKEQRKKFGSNHNKSRLFTIGYYGAALDSTDAVKVKAPEVTIYNSGRITYIQEQKGKASKLVTEIVGTQNFNDDKSKYVNAGVQSALKDTLSLAVTLPDGENKNSLSKISVTVSGASSRQKQEFQYDFSDGADNKSWTSRGNNYYLTLDDISRSDGHFTQIFKDFIPGENITVSVQLVSRTGALSVEKTIPTNSLFDKADENTNTVEVRSPRQLQNLEPKVSDVLYLNSDKERKNKSYTQPFAINNVNVTGDIDWNWNGTRDGSSTEKIYQYDNSPAGKNDEGRKDFLSISNSQIQNFDGQSHTISNLKAVDNEISADENTKHNDAGLFAYTAEDQDLSVNNLTLENSSAEVQSGTGSAGSLIGEAAGNLQISNVDVIASDNIEISAAGTSSDVNDSVGSAGGLIGYSSTESISLRNVNIHSADHNNSFNDSIVVYGQNRAGGIIGFLKSDRIEINYVQYDGGSHGIIKSDFRDAGGFIGRLESDGKAEIADSYSTSYVYTDGKRLARAGGFIGYINQKSGTVNISRCFYGGRTKDDGTYDVDDDPANDPADIIKGSWNITNNSAVTEDGDHATAGGFVGSVNGSAGTVTVSDSYTTGSVFVNNGCVGGFAGQAGQLDERRQSPLVLKNTYTTARVKSVSADSSAGVYIGRNIISSDSSDNYYLEGINSSDVRVVGSRADMTINGISSASNTDSAGPFNVSDHVSADPYADLGNQYAYKFVNQLENSNTFLTQHVGDWPTVRTDGKPHLNPAEGTLFYKGENAWVTATVDGYSSMQFYFTFDGTDPKTSSTRSNSWNGFNVSPSIPTGVRTLADGTVLGKDEFEIRIVGDIVTYDSSGAAHHAFTSEAVYKYYLVQPIYYVGVTYQDKAQPSNWIATIGTKLSDLTFKLSQNSDVCDFNEEDGISFFTKDGDKETPLSSDTVIQNDRDYYVRVHLSAKPGYGFRSPDDPVITQKTDEQSKKTITEVTYPKVDGVQIENEKIDESDVLRYGDHNSELNFVAKIKTGYRMMDSITPSGSRWNENLKRGEAIKLSYDVSPEVSRYNPVTFSSSDENIVHVDQEGYVTALKAGNATVTIKAADGGQASAAIQINVTEPENDAVTNPDNIPVGMKIRQDLFSNDRNTRRVYVKDHVLYYAVDSDPQNDIAGKGLSYLKNRISTVNIPDIVSEYTFAESKDSCISLEKGEVVFNDGKFYLNLQDRSNMTMKDFLDDQDGYVILNDENDAPVIEDKIPSVSIENGNQLLAKIDISGLSSTNDKIYVAVKDVQNKKIVTAAIDKNNPGAAGGWLAGAGTNGKEVVLILDDPSNVNSTFHNRFSSFTPGDDIAVYAANSSDGLQNILSSVASGDAGSSNGVIYEASDSKLYTIHKAVDNSLYGSGSGNEENPNTALIGNQRHLKNLNSWISGINGTGMLGASYKAKQTANLDLGNTAYNYFLADENANNYLSEYDGGGHSITGLKIETGNNSYLGLFGTIRNKFDIKNLTLSQTNYRSWSNKTDIGGLIGTIEKDGNVTVNNIIINGLHIDNSNGAAGGIVGECDGTLNISNSAVEPYTDESGNVKNNVYVATNNGSAGGMIGNIGQNGTVTIQSSAVYGDNLTDNKSLIKGNSTAGGLIGNNSGKNTEITDSSASIYVEGNSSTGGLIGYIGKNSSSKIIASYVGGHTSNQKYAASENSGKNISANGGTVGGFIGQDESTIGTNIKYCYTTASAYSAANSAVVGGFIGSSTDKTDISYSYAAGLVTSSGYQGIAGKFDGGSQGIFSNDYVLNGINDGEMKTGGAETGIQTVDTGTGNTPFMAESNKAYPYDAALYTSGTTDKTGIYPYMTAFQLMSLSAESEDQDIKKASEGYTLCKEHHGDWMPVTSAASNSKRNLLNSVDLEKNEISQNMMKSDDSMPQPSISPTSAPTPSPSPQAKDDTSDEQKKSGFPTSSAKGSSYALPNTQSNDEGPNQDDEEPDN